MSFGEEQLDSAIHAMRETPVPPGPSAELMERTRQSMRVPQTLALPARRQTWRWAAAIILAGSVALAWRMTQRHSPMQVAQDPSNQPLVAPTPVASPYVGNPSPRLIGVVRIEGHPPQLQQATVAENYNGCPHHHPTPPDDSMLIARDGGLANVVVSVTAGLPADSEYPKPASPAVLNQKDCRYAPHVVAIRVGQEVLARNSDPILHNVHTNPLENEPMNFAQYTVDPVGTRMKPIKAAETFKVTCDLHPWMTAWVAAFDHPYFAVTGPDGSFEMPLLPPGTYTLRAWHERLGHVEQQVTLSYDHKIPPVMFKYGPDRVAAAMQDRIITADAK